jgi:hypothetical protein
MTVWTDEGWIASVQEWIIGALEQRGIRAIGPIDQPHVRSWSTVMSVPTANGRVWFKANIPRLAYEARVVQLIARERPLAGPDLLAVDAARGWMLTADGGSRLRELISAEQRFDRWLDVLPVYAQLQRALARFAEELIESGVPDRRLSRLPLQFEALINHDLGLDRKELRRVRGLVSWVRDACEELAELNIPETLQHDDLHDGQIFFRDGRYLISDWNDSCVSHPFLTMAVTLEGQLQWGFEDVEASVDVEPFRDAYLEPFTAIASRQKLNVAMSKALRLGWICRALTYASALHPPDVDADPEAPAVRLRMFLEYMPQEI